jgi:DNA-binding response OmpR family regulator
MPDDPPPPKPRPVVLVVDDSPETLSFLTDALEDANFTVLVALQAQNALTLVHEMVPDIILMDAIMPGMDGFETCRRLKSNPRLAYVPVIFMTGLSETEDVVKGFEAGGVDFVTKPIVPDELVARMMVHLNNARLGQSARNALDAAGRYFLAVTPEGRVLWCTPQASKLLGAAFPAFPAQDFVLPIDVKAALKTRQEHSRPLSLSFDLQGLQLSYVGQIGPDEHLLRLIEIDSTSDERLVKQRFSLTPREADVLVWIARGKSNRDIGAILGLSPRTVNKHLEQIYAKLGIENRASAAALVVRALNNR